MKQIYDKVTDKQQGKVDDYWNHILWLLPVNFLQCVHRSLCLRCYY